MKRKLWIMLALAALLTLLCCSAALATDTFVTQPSSTFRGSDCNFVISWKTSFTPVEVKILKSGSGGSMETVADITSAADLKAAMSWPIPAHKEAHSTDYYVYAYSSATAVACSLPFSNDWDSIGFTDFATCSYIQGYQAFRIETKASFTPKKVTASVFYEREVVNDTSGRSYIFIPLSEANTGGYWLRVYYGTGDEDYIENGYFRFDWDNIKFYKEPTVGVNGAGDKFKVSWETSYIPQTLQIWKHSSSGDTMIEEITEGFSWNMDYELPFTTDPTNVNYTVRAYYNSSEYRDSQPFIKDFSVLKFTTQPNNGLVAPGGCARVSWVTSFTPIRIEIGYKSSTGFTPRITLTQQLGKSMHHDIAPNDVIAPQLTVRAYYRTHSFVDSSPFSLTLTGDYYFTASPSGGALHPNYSMLLTWATNYTPDHIEILARDEGSADAYLVKEITKDITRSMSSYLPWDKAGLGNGSAIVRAWFNPVSYVDAACTVQRIPPSFTQLPAGGTVNPGKTLLLSWKTDFKPTRVEIGYMNGGTWTVTDTITDEDDLSLSMKRTVPYEKLINGTMGIRAYSDRIYASGEFQVNKNAPAFTQQPAGGAVYPWKPLELRWRCNFTPAAVKIGYVRNGSFIDVATLENPETYGTYTLDYDHAVTSAAWEVRAQYSGVYYSSTSLSIEKRAAYVCGSGLTATFADGTLTITGTGEMNDYNASSNPPPWYDIRGLIQRVVIENGAAGIGNQAFFNCTKLTDITIPASVTRVGRYAFEYTGLRTVDYKGLRSQWQQLSIGAGNSSLQNAGIRYLYRSGTVAGGVYYTLEGCSDKLTVYGDGGSGVHVTSPWYAWAPYIAEIEVQGLDTLWEDAFRDCTGVTRVYLDKWLTLVDDGAFCDCGALTDVYYSSTRADWDNITVNSNNGPLLAATVHTTAHVEQLTGDLSWSVDDTGLLRIWLDDDLMGDGEDTAIPTYSYANSASTAPWFTSYADTITVIHVESGVTSIGSNAFAGLKKARTIDIADSVTAIGAAAFLDCSMLEDFTLPDSILSIGNGAFRNCTNLEQVFLPDRVTSLGGWVFRGCGNLVKVRLPSQIDAIPKQTFYGCTLLEDVDIPVTVTSIGDYAFFNCTGLVKATGHVYYGGTSAQWKEITISATGNGSLQNAANIHMNPEELRLSAANFPDANFRSVVANAFDTDQSGWLTDAEIAAVDSFDTEDTDYTTVQGMEFFTEMTFLMLDGAPSLTGIDLSANTKLTHVEVFDNGLTALNLDGLTELRELDCDGNALVSLDVSPFDLTELFCYNNPMGTLTFGNQPDLQRLYCYGTNLATMDLRGCPLLIDCVMGGTRTVKNDFVEYATDSGCLLRVDASTELIYPGVIPIDEAHFPDAAFRSLVAEVFDDNGSGWLTAEEIAALDDEGDPKSLNVSDAGVMSLQGIEYLTELRVLSVSGCPLLTSVDLSGNTKLRFISFYQTGLVSLDVEGLALTHLSCDFGPLESLALGAQMDLRVLSCYQTDLTVVDVIGCPHLITAWCGEKYSDSQCDSYTGGSYSLTVNPGAAVITGLPAPTFFLPTDLTAIEADAFQYIAAEAVQIPAGVTEISGNPFAGSSVRYIYGFTDLVRIFAGDNGYIFVPVRE